MFEHITMTGIVRHRCAFNFEFFLPDDCRQKDNSTIYIFGLRYIFRRVVALVFDALFQINRHFFVICTRMKCLGGQSACSKVLVKDNMVFRVNSPDKPLFI